MSGELFLCLDQGGHSSRALVLDSNAGIRAYASRPVATHRVGERVEHDPRELLATLRESAVDAVTQLGTDAGKVIAAGLATQRSSVVCWNRHTREALTAVLSWQDTRAADWISCFSDSWQRVHDLTGLVLSPYYGVSKLHWCLKNEPAVIQAARSGQLYCGPLASFLAQCLTGSPEAYADPANGSRTLVWDRATGDWSQELLELFGLPGYVLPAAVPSRHAWGEISLGTVRVPLTTVTGDQSAALFAFGSPRSDTAYINLGTGAFAQRLMPPSTDPGRLLASVVYQDDRPITAGMEGPVNGAGSALSEIAARRGIGREHLHAHASGWLAAASDPPLFLNGVGGLGSPWWLADCTSRFIPDPADDAAAVAAVLESIAFLLTVNLQQMERSLGPAQRIVVTGGLSAVESMLQTVADTSGVTVQRASVREATAAGLGWLLAGLPEDWPKVCVDAEFNPSSNRGLQRRFTAWLQAMPSIPR